MKGTTIGQCARMATEAHSCYPYRYARKGSRLQEALWNNTKAACTQDDREYIITRMHMVTGGIAAAVRLGLYEQAAQ